MMVRKPKQQRAKVTVDTIIQAGFIAVSQSGIHGATTRQIAEISGIGVGSLYEYFENKEAIYQAMNQHFVNDIVDMLRKLTPNLVRLNLHDVVELLLNSFSDLLRKDGGIYLKYVRYSRYSPLIETALMEFAMRYAMHNPKFLRLENMATINYICITGGIFSVIRHLSTPTPNVTFDQLLEGLSRMTTSYFDAEFARLDQVEKPGH
ncbi:TetR/AcrR family transcriptional regulator [Aquirhabdus sp.]|uniref:TetR/AcrR family transcriptional regulator n=1 Tax=Aquirhabdus sp. TaxID=2824160 RepID=UPI00396CCA5D